MTHDLRRHGFPLQRTVPPLHFMARPQPPGVARLQPPVNNGAAELLLQSQRHHGLILTLAHELRQPLSAMFGAIEILHDVRSSAGVSKAIEVIDRQAHHMARLVEEVVESARWTRSTALLRLERVDLRVQIAEALYDAGESVAARERQIVASDMPEPLWVDADPAHLRQVLSNLLDNAIKFTAPGGRIHLTACRAGREIIMRVRDSGRGLRPDELAHIFELFSQVRPGEGSGLGIGLHIASEIVALHKGRIEVHSDGPTCGSEFTVVLPAAASMS